MTTLRASDKRRLTLIAREYRDKGYEVIIQPDQNELPNFLKSFQPAMVAFGNDENVVL